MTKDEAKAIAVHLRAARLSLAVSSPATDPHIERLHAIEESLTPGTVGYNGDIVTALETLKRIYDDLEKLTEIRPNDAGVGQAIPGRGKPVLLPGVADAMSQIEAAGAALNDINSPSVGNAST